MSRRHTHNEGHEAITAARKGSGGGAEGTEELGSGKEGRRGEGREERIGKGRKW